MNMLNSHERNEHGNGTELEYPIQYYDVLKYRSSLYKMHMSNWEHSKESRRGCKLVEYSYI